MALWDWFVQKPRWSFVIDTDSYSGNFVREMSSYVVGQCDEHGEHMGEPYREMYEKELPDNPFEDLVEFRVADPGDDGIMRSPADIAPTPGWSNDGTGRCKGPGSEEESPYPAYQSVAIFLSRRPNRQELRVLTERATSFTALPEVEGRNIRPRVIGCRLVEEVLTVKSTAVQLLA